MSSIGGVSSSGMNTVGVNSVDGDPAGEFSANDTSTGGTTSPFQSLLLALKTGVCHGRRTSGTDARHTVLSRSDGANSQVGDTPEADDTKKNMPSEAGSDEGISLPVTMLAFAGDATALHQSMASPGVSDVSLGESLGSLTPEVTPDFKGVRTPPLVLADSVKLSPIVSSHEQLAMSGSGVLRDVGGGAQVDASEVTVTGSSGTTSKLKNSSRPGTGAGGAGDALMHAAKGNTGVTRTDSPNEAVPRQTLDDLLARIDHQGPQAAEGGPRYERMPDGVGQASSGGGTGHALRADAAGHADIATQGMGFGSAEGALSDNLRVWVGQTLHAAQLQLDRGTDRSVEIQVSLNGKDAQVVFLADQPEVRQALQGNAAQLRDMLGSQGLQLSGVAVDAFAQSHHAAPRYQGTASSSRSESDPNQTGTVNEVQPWTQGPAVRVKRGLVDYFA